MPGIWQNIENYSKRKRGDRSQGLKEGQNFSKKLLQLWSLGKLSSPGLQELASAAAADGLQRLLIWQFFESYPGLAPRLFGLEKLEAFWAGLKENDPRLWESGLKERQKHRTIPLWLHGDGVEFSTDTLMTFSWGPTLYAPQGLEESPKEEHASHSMDSSFLITAWPKSATASGTWEEIHEVMAWSFAALFQNFHPERDWKGRPLPAKLVRLARKPITPEKSVNFGFSIFWVI